MALLLASAELSIINSSHHIELGKMFWLKKDYKILSFKDYNKEKYSKLLVVFLLITINFFICLTLVGLTFALKDLDMLFVMIGFNVWLIVTVVLSMIEYIIYKIKYC
jgi:ABC-type multidrug transport system permease subunit